MSKRSDRLILIRHALTAQDPALPSYEWSVAEGQEAACKQLAVRLRGLAPTRVITSRERKAVETGKLIAGQLGVPTEPADGLEEHHRDGVAFEPDPVKWRDLLRRLFTRPAELVFGNETANQALQRFSAALHRQLTARPGERLAVVSHATVMTLFLASHNSIDSFEFWSTVSMPEAWLLELPGFRLLDRFTV